MPLADPTYIGQVASVTGSVVRVRLREDMPSTLVMIAGESYRVGQIGGFFRLPLGYTVSVRPWPMFERLGMIHSRL
jgi:hypothetical protein